MQRPHSWVIRIVLNHNVARHRPVRVRRLQQLHISSLRILNVLDGAVPGAGALGKHIKVVAVKMHRMRSREVISNDDAYRGISAEVVDVPLGVVRVREVALISKNKERVAGAVVRKSESESVW